ncbi:MAG: fibronectin type III domain-containing protein [Alistipes sp.]|jgi:hypothetical protein|nr:fibronectin type III domain-containing protein [Alistipes sp.]
MKKLLKLAGFCALVIGLAVSCEKTPETPEPLNLTAPVNLASSGVTTTGATLTWDAVEGAERYNVRINDGDPILATSNTYAAAELSPESDYTWAVQAFTGDVYSEWSADATFSTPASPLEVPTNLAATEKTQTTATLTWDIVERATGYEVRIDDNEQFIPVAENSYDLTDLTAETQYTWTVRAIEKNETMDRASEWADEATFTTLPIPVTEVTFTKAVGTDNGTEISADTNNFLVELFESDAESDGYRISFDLVSPKVDRDVFLQYLGIPNGDYNLADTRAPYTVTGKTVLELVADGDVADSWEITEGTFNIIGVYSEGYVVTVELPYQEGIFRGTYEGKIDVTNGNYDATVKNMGTMEIAGIAYKSAAYAGVDTYTLTVTGEGQIDGNGSGWSILEVPFNVAAGVEGNIPEGKYTITGDNAVNTVRAGYRDMVYTGQNIALQAVQTSNNALYAIGSGSVTVTHVDGNYQIVIDGEVPYGGGRYIGTITGAIE